MSIIFCGLEVESESQGGWKIMKRKEFFVFRAAVLFFLIAVLALIIFIQPKPTRGDRSDLKGLGLEEFVQSEITYDGVMHELYWHYEFANQMIRVARVEDAKAHLRIISFYVNLLPYVAREKKFFSNPESVRKFDQYAQDLIKITDQIRKNLGRGNIEESGRELEKRISYICYHCHKDLKTPIRDITPYGKKVEMGAGRRNPQ